MRDPSYDYLLVGGGLQSALLALALAKEQPGAKVALIEREAKLGGNHTWCFHGGDIPPDGRELVEPLVVQQWSRYSVHFNGYQRTVESPYAVTTSARLDAVVSELSHRHPSLTLFLGANVNAIEAGSIKLSSGLQLRAPVVVDSRGPQASALEVPCGYQKF
ncbi:MAG TPA: lycopene cyclase family protein, partial [Polyangiaceae bacterium]